MTFNDCIKKIDRYLLSESAYPLFVDVQSIEDLEKLLTHYRVDGNSFLSASKFCNYDELPRFEDVIHELAERTDKVFLLEVTSYLKLLGEEELSSVINTLLRLKIQGRVVLFSFQCKKYFENLQVSDPRLGMRISVLDGEPTSMPQLLFITKDMPISSVSETVDGIGSLAKIIENSSSQEIYIVTSKLKEDFPLSLYPIKEMNNYFKMLIMADSSLQSLEESYGTNAQWQYLLSLFQKKSSMIEVINSEFANYQTLEVAIAHYRLYDDRKKWLYFIALKLYGAKNNWCLNSAILTVRNFEELTRAIFRTLLGVSHEDKDFNEYYEVRKKLLIMLENPLDEVIDYCNIVKHKGKDSIHYLTDNTQQEKELIFSLLDKYHEQFTQEQITSILKTIYPDLAVYLKTFRFKIPLLERYFTMYNYCKVINKVLPDFKEMVLEQATLREFNFLLQPRTARLERIEKNDSALYFLDALGVEYLSYIQAKCQEMDMSVNISLCRATLPSITSLNKEFINDFESLGVQIINIKKLDEIKHHGMDGHDYTKTKLPIHLIGEMKIIEDLLVTIKVKLNTSEFRKAIIVSDHGASRLAVIQESENIWEMFSKGEHSGRCCLVDDADVQSPYAIEENGFWVLANYDRFKGSRKANVEVHGGATLEEVTVPIIEISNSHEKLEVILLDEIISVSFRKKASIRLFCKTKLPNLSIKINGEHYNSREIDENTYLFEMPQIKKAQKYSFDVFSGDNMIASNLTFTVEKEGAQEKDLL